MDSAPSSPLDLAADLARRNDDDAARLLTDLLEQAAAASPGLSEAETAVCGVLADPDRGAALVARIPLDTLERVARRLLSAPPLGDRAEIQGAGHCLLEAFRHSSFLKRVTAAGAVESWTDTILRLVDATDFTFASLWAQRTGRYGAGVLFRVPGDDGRHRDTTWDQAAGRVDLIARSLLALTAEIRREPVAILSRNSLEMALVDLACLSSGIVDVMVPATATETEVAYILRHSGVGVVLASEELLETVLRVRERVAGLEHVIALDGRALPRGVMSLDQLLRRAGEVSPTALARRRSGTRVSDRATIMYTSGTTGTPKGIGFSHRNIVFKRFARALALPELGEDDRFLCYLPLFHTFGRFLEMTGCVFWGATYCFASGTGIRALTERMQADLPTVFISIPLKWMQLYDAIRQEVDVEADSDEDIREAVHRITGGALRWGLSAAGYLDPAVFRFFQRYGVELMSGFGMTEATGGITMTPPGRYRDDSLGCALPGIELRLADDGELQIRGPYVMTGYVDPPDGAPSFDQDGWLATGDVMEADEDGFLSIVDRKKEIYKNAKGQTIAPQKVENLFRDFPSVGRIFLVGDHRPYNTALVWPNPDFEEVDFSTLSPAEIKSHFRSLVVSVNAFLAPHERIVDFAILDRDLSVERDELTAKGTFRRKTIERHFAEEIRLLYRRAVVTVGGVDVIVPNWLFQSLGVTSEALAVDGDSLRLGDAGGTVHISRAGPDRVRVGPAVYHHRERSVDLGLFLSTPRLWLGNEQLHDLASLTLEERSRRRREAPDVRWLRRVEPYHPTGDDAAQVADLLHRHEMALDHVHLAALLLAAGRDTDVASGLELLEHLVDAAPETLAEPVRGVLRRGPQLASSSARRRAFRLLFPIEQPDRARRTLAAFADSGGSLFDEVTSGALAARTLGAQQLEAVVAEAELRVGRAVGDAGERDAVAGLLGFLAAYGAAHPTSFRQLRTVLVRAARLGLDSGLRLAAHQARLTLEEGFRRWLGSPSTLAVDPETGDEYRWKDVVVFADDVPDGDRRRLLVALTTAPILREAGFLFANASTVRLEDILPGGVWVSRLGTSRGKTVYRLAVRTRGREQLDIAVNLTDGLALESVEEEVDWLVVCSDSRRAAPLVEQLGGYWPEHQLWSEEFIPGETLDHAVQRLAARPEGGDRLHGYWPHAVWSAAGAYVDFWSRTGRRLVIANPRPGNVIVPLHDYQTDARLVSITEREGYESVARLLECLDEALVQEVERDHPELAGSSGWTTLLSSFTEVVGETESLELLDVARHEAGEELATAISAFTAAVRDGAFMPRRLHFASLRYRRWQEINPEATIEARAATLQELYETYGLQRLADRYPAIRPRFFRETVFRTRDDELSSQLDSLIQRLRSAELGRDEVSAAVADLRASLQADQEDDYFLARLSYPHLRPEDVAGFIPAESTPGPQSEMVVTRHDHDGRPFSIRHVLSTREIGRLHRMFLTAKLEVQFRPEDRFMVAISDRGHLMGGLFYDLDPESQRAHMDKVVVADRFQGRGVARALLDELCNRLASAGIRTLTTGFFRPEFFYRHGFSVERRYAGLVRRLDESASPHP